MLDELFKTNCVKYGKFTLKSGEISKYYFDMKGLVSHPLLMADIGTKIHNELLDKECDLLCGVPMGGLPICSYLSIHYNIPMIMVRNEVKTYGTNKQIEGVYSKKNKCVIIEDVITSGGSVNKVVELLKDKVNIIGIVVLLDRQEGYTCKVPVKSVFCKTDLINHKLNQLIEKKKSKLCFSADLDNKRQLIDILQSIGDKIVICKIHYDFYEDENQELKTKLIELSIEKDFLLMEDRKFVDISYTVEKQYRKYAKWIDLITVMGNVNTQVVSKLSGVVLVRNMSNNNYDYIDRVKEIVDAYPKHITGIVTQYRIDLNGLINMTPGINKEKNKVGDQNYRSVEEVDTDIVIVGRGIYESDNYKESAEHFRCY
jgi:uridine monophosphate synthetase